eukprot:1617622-Ditylum_brightwellii.AAC.1
MFGETAIPYSAKWQIIAATSSTGAEFVQAVSTTKMTRYLRTVINELNAKQHGPTMIYKDNAAVIMMANTSKPNGYACHININYFTLQEW